MTILICKWCEGEFKVNTSKGKSGCFPFLMCPHCGASLPGSRIESTGNIIGRKHIHLKYRNGDIAG